MSVPSKWKWLLDPKYGMPKLVLEGLKEYGTIEGGGTSNNPKIIGWADEVARFTHSNYDNWAADWYNKDSIAWCGLYMAVLCVRTTRFPVKSYLSALAWASFEKSVPWRDASGIRLGNIWTGDIAVFSRSGGGHVGVVIGISVDGRYIYILGGNQDNAVSIKMFPIGRLYSVRRPKYRVPPVGAKHLRLSITGAVSTNEA